MSDEKREAALRAYINTGNASVERGGGTDQQCRLLIIAQNNLLILLMDRAARASNSPR